MTPAGCRAALAAVVAGLALWVGLVWAAATLARVDPWLGRALAAFVLLPLLMIVLGRFGRWRRSRRLPSGPERTYRCAVCTAEPYAPHASWCNAGPPDRVLK